MRKLYNKYALSCTKLAVTGLLLTSLLPASLNATGSVDDLSYYETRGNWTLADGYIEGSGVGSLLFLPQYFGPADFKVHLRLSLITSGREGTAASIQFSHGASQALVGYRQVPQMQVHHFGLDAEPGQLFVQGAIFDAARARLIRPQAGLFEEGEPFDFVMVRNGDELSFFINEQLLYQAAVSGEIGQVGVRPHRATIRIHAVEIEAEPTAREIAMEAFHERLQKLEGPLEHFLREPALDKQPLFEGPRFPNVAVALDGTVIATWGREGVRSRRSVDGGKTWEQDVPVGPGRHGGGLTVDEVSGDILVWTEDPNLENTRLFRSVDQGQSWQQETSMIIYALDRKASGVIPNVHMNESGITLRRGPHAGRLLRTTGNYMGGNIRGGPADAFANAIYSDDGGITWDTSAPFPAFGTNEAAVAELTDGRILFIARRHRATDGLDTQMKHFAWSYDSGESWRNLRVSPILPDGNTNRPYGLMHGLVRLPVEGRDILIFSNIVSDTARENGTIWASFDGGETWPIKRLIEPGQFSYSSLAAGRPGTPSEGWIYLLYESSGNGHIARFNLSWLLQEGIATGDGLLPTWLVHP